MNRFRRHPAQSSIFQTQHAKMLLKEHISRALSTSEGQNNGNGDRQKLEKNEKPLFYTDFEPFSLLSTASSSFQTHHTKMPFYKHGSRALSSSEDKNNGNGDREKAQKVAFLLENEDISFFYAL